MCLKNTENCRQSRKYKGLYYATFHEMPQSMLKVKPKDVYIWQSILQTIGSLYPTFRIFSLDLEGREETPDLMWFILLVWHNISAFTSAVFRGLPESLLCTGGASTVSIWWWYTSVTPSSDISFPKTSQFWPMSSKNVAAFVCPSSLYLIGQHLILYLSWCIQLVACLYLVSAAWISNCTCGGQCDCKSGFVLPVILFYGIKISREIVLREQKHCTYIVPWIYNFLTVSLYYPQVLLHDHRMRGNVIVNRNICEILDLKYCLSCFNQG